MKSFRFGLGKHSSRDKGMCIMEAAAFLAGEPHTDRPQCVCPVITQVAIKLNDGTSDKQRQELCQDIPWRAVGTRGDKALEIERLLILVRLVISKVIPDQLDRFARFGSLTNSYLSVFLRHNLAKKLTLEDAMGAKRLIGSYIGLISTERKHAHTDDERYHRAECHECSLDLARVQRSVCIKQAFEKFEQAVEYLELFAKYNPSLDAEFNPLPGFQKGCINQLLDVHHAFEPFPNDKPAEKARILNNQYIAKAISDMIDLTEIKERLIVNSVEGLAVGPS